MRKKNLYQILQILFLQHDVMRELENGGEMDLLENLEDLYQQTEQLLLSILKITEPTQTEDTLDTISMFLSSSKREPEHIKSLLQII